MDRYNITLDSYKVFYTVAKCGNITKAAEELFVTQPSVSMSIKALEEKLGCNLLIRLPKGIKLSNEGEMLFSYLTQAIGLIDLAERKFDELHHLEAGEISICASDSIISGLLLPYLENYNNAYENISIKVINRTSKETIDLLRKGTIDLGFINMPYDDEEYIEILKKIPVHDCLVYGTKFEDHFKMNFEIKKISEIPLLMLKNSSHVRRLLDIYAKQNDITINPLFEFDSTDLLIKFSKINLGVAFTIEEFVKEEVDNKTIFLRRLNPQIDNRAIGMVKLKNISLSNAAAKFVDMILTGEKE